ncbi:MAG: hypothetical protein J1E64_15295 [Acetatifactor sp.]|nr:hypothetical protein [Acetatifactor sp.]
MRSRIAVLTALMMLGLSGCTGPINGAFVEALLEGTEESQAPLTQTYEIPYYNMSFTLPKDWEERDSTPYDLQCYNGSAYFSVFAFLDIDLGENSEPYDYYVAQREDLFSKRDNVAQVEEAVYKSYEDKVVMTELWSAERDGLKNYYYCCLVDFLPDDQGFAWVIFTGVPSYVSREKDTFDEILASAKYTSISY